MNNFTHQGECEHTSNHNVEIFQFADHGHVMQLLSWCLSIKSSQKNHLRKVSFS